ncbi:MAG: branched-chain amino acid ABC transporter permease [Spirochaetes bacterium]|nr:MAG: branched-chain amino acid ABC transporter permease [Spirochaetota bacterium]
MVIQMILNGLMLGLSYALIALGLTLIFAIMNILNFAHGQMYMLGGFVVYYFYYVFGLNYFFALFMCIPTLALIGVIFEKFFFRRVLTLGRREESSMLLAMGTALLLENIALIAFGYKEQGVPPLIHGVIKIFGGYLPADRAFIILMSVLLIIGLLVFIYKTRPGRALRALAQDKEVTYLMGVDVNKITMLGFAVGAALAGLAGGLLALTFPIFSGSGTPITIKSFLMIMIGGAGVVPGAIIGGFLLGMVESFGYGLISGSMTYLIIFAMIILLLIFRPQGIMGKPWG